MRRAIKGGAALVAFVLAGCGSSVSASDLPLPSDMHVAADTEVHALAVGTVHSHTLLVVGPASMTSEELQREESNHLTDAGWDVNTHYPKAGYFVARSGTGSSDVLATFGPPAVIRRAGGLLPRLSHQVRQLSAKRVPVLVVQLASYGD